MSWGEDVSSSSQHWGGGVPRWVDACQHTKKKITNKTKKNVLVGLSYTIARYIEASLLLSGEELNLRANLVVLAEGHDVRNTVGEDGARAPRSVPVRVDVVDGSEQNKTENSYDEQKITGEGK